MIPTGRSIEFWRIERGMSQAQLALAAEIARPNLSMIEQGKRDLTVGTLRKIAHALSINPGILADGIAPSGSSQVWTREKLDRLAQYLAGVKKIRLSNQEIKIAESLKPVLRTRTLSSPQTLSRRGIGREQKSLHFSKNIFTQDEFRNLLERIEKWKQISHE